MANVDNPQLRPSVLIVGGFGTMPPNYWAFRRRLLRRGAGRVDICPLWPPDWLLGGVLGFGGVLRRTGRGVAATYVEGGRRPIIVVAHSAGGIAARLAMSTVPFHGRVAGVAEAVGCLVTLGTPHGLATLPSHYRHAGHEAAEFLARETPGAYFAPRTGYLTVGADNPGGRFPGASGALVHELFRVMVGDGPDALGDGIVPVAAVHLEGARRLTFDDVRHGMIGGPWYGDDAVIDRWWPTALELWHQALDARARGAVAIGERDAEAAATLGSVAESAAKSGVKGALEQESAESLELEVAGWSSGSSSGS